MGTFRGLSGLVTALACIVISGCGAMQPAAPATVFQTDDSKLLAAFDESNTQASTQTELLREIASGQRALLNRFDESLTDDIAKSIQTSMPSKSTEAKEDLDDDKKVKADEDPSAWPKGVRIQVWKDQSAECLEWLETEAPLLGVDPEYFETGSDLAAKYQVNSFTIMLVDTAGKIDQRLTAPFSAGQLQQFAKETAAKGLSKASFASMTKNSCTCTCPNCNCTFACDCSGGTCSPSVSVSRPVQSYSQPVQSYQTYSAPVETWVSRPSKYQSTVRWSNGSVKTNTRMRCEGGRCFAY